MIEIGTAFLLDDEPCFCLTEDDHVENLKRNRYRSYTVVRGDRLATYREDMGNSKKFKTDPIRVMGGVVDEFTGKIYIEHTVGELRDIAQSLRNKPMFKMGEFMGIAA